MTPPTALGVVGSARVAAGGPATIPNLQAWYDAADAATFTLTGALVEQWRDKSGKNVTLNAAAAGKRPSRSGTQNGKPTVVFNNHYMRTAAGATAIGAATSAVTIFTAIKRSAASAGFDEIPANLSAGNGGAPLTGWGTSRYMETYGFPGYTDMNANVTIKSWCVLTLEIFSPDARIMRVSEYLNGPQTQTQDVVDKPFTAANQVVGVGSRDDGATAFLGEVAEVLMYDRILTPVERGNVDTYLRTKWGTP